MSSNIYHGLPVKMLSMFPAVLEPIIQYYHLSYPAVQQNTRTYFPPVYKSGHHGPLYLSCKKENELVFRIMFLVEGNQDTDIGNT